MNWRKTRSAAPCGRTGGASRWRPTTASRRTSRWSTARRTAVPLCTLIPPRVSSASTRKRPRPWARATGPGLDITPEHAIGWITRNAARSLGIDAVTGTLAPGKMADVVVWSGNPFSVYSKADLGICRRSADVRPGRIRLCSRSPTLNWVSCRRWHDETHFNSHCRSAAVLPATGVGADPADQGGQRTHDDGCRRPGTAGRTAARRSHRGDRPRAGSARGRGGDCCRGATAYPGPLRRHHGPGA